MRWLGEVPRLADRAGAAAETRWAAIVVFLASVAAWWLEALPMPLAGGRDFGTYLGAYIELFQANPIDLGYVLGRTPVAPLAVGGLLDPLGGALAEPGMSILYGLSVLAWFLAARSFGGKAALLTALVLVLYPGYGILFHELASDSVFAVVFAGWSLLAVRVLLAPTTSRFAFLGVGVALLVLVRPGNQALLLLALLPLVVALPWRSRIAGSAALFLSAVAILGAWTVHNGLRFGDYTVARGGNSRLPFERVFLTEQIVRPENGPASRRLAEAVQRQLLPEEPYRSYGIGLADFFSDPSPRMIVDLGVLANELDGWQSDQRLLREVGIEAVRTHPGAYARGVMTTIWGLLHRPVYRQPGQGGGSQTQDEAPPSSSAGREGSGAEKLSPSASADTIVVEGRRLPRPSEGERIPAPHEGGPTTPDRSIYTVWTSPTEHHLVFVHPGDEARYDRLHQEMDELAGALPDRRGNEAIVHRINQASRWFPPPALWLLLGVIGLAVRRPRHGLALVTPALAGAIVIVLNALAIATVPHYAVPAEPAFVLLAAGALLGRRRARQREVTSSSG